MCISYLNEIFISTDVLWFAAHTYPCSLSCQLVQQCECVVFFKGFVDNYRSIEHKKKKKVSLFIEGLSDQGYVDHNADKIQNSFMFMHL